MLVVDDDVKITSMLRRALSYEGYQVVLAGSGEEVLRLTAGSHYDLVILDVMLPGVNGIEVCRRLRLTFHTQNLPVLMLTARDEVEDRVLGLDSGADDYLIKPFSLPELLARVRALLRRPRLLPMKTVAGIPPPAAGEKTAQPGPAKPAAGSPDWQAGDWPAGSQQQDYGPSAGSAYVAGNAIPGRVPVTGAAGNVSRMAPDTECLYFADLVMDLETREIWRSKRPLILTAREFDLLALFLRNPRRVLRRDEIMDRIWGYDFSGESNVLEVYVGYLRSKLEAGGEKRLIHTVRSVGYVLR